MIWLIHALQVCLESKLFSLSGLEEVIFSVAPTADVYNAWNYAFISHTSLERDAQ